MKSQNQFQKFQEGHDAVYDVIEPDHVSVENSGITTTSILEFTNTSLFFTASGRRHARR
ncbi:hypothetical protein OROGR_026810 [Orobanche gracilis]